MSEVTAEIFRRYGLGALFAAGALVSIIWITAHWMAAPGEQVSVLWGAVEYTKERIKDPVEYPTDMIVYPDKNSASTETTDEREVDGYQYQLAQISLEIEDNVTEQSADDLLKRFRSNRNLRELSSFESNFALSRIPDGKYSFVFAASIATDIEADGRLGAAPANRYRDGTRGYFEVHHYNNDFQLLAFVTASAAARVSILDGNQNRDVTLFPYPWGEVDTLVAIPTSRLQSSKVRWIEVDPETTFLALDVVMR